MIRPNTPNMMYAWQCSLTGIIWQDSAAETEAWAQRLIEQQIGKRRASRGSVKLFEVTFRPADKEPSHD